MGDIALIAFQSGLIYEKVKGLLGQSTASDFQVNSII